MLFESTDSDLKNFEQTAHDVSFDGQLYLPSAPHNLGFMPGPLHTSTALLHPTLEPHEDLSHITPFPLGEDDVNDHLQPYPDEHLDPWTYDFDASNVEGFAGTSSLEPIEPFDPDLINAYVMRVLEIIPDVHLDYLTALIVYHLPSSQDDVVDDVVSVLCEDKTYPRMGKGKGKGKVLETIRFGQVEESLLNQQVRAGEANVIEWGNPPVYEEYRECEDGVECGCCFAKYPFDKMIQCPDTHLFCGSCITSYASGLLGANNPNIVCMDQSGCKLTFPESELQRMLSNKLMELYNRVKQTKEIEAASLENLEECPFCEYKVVIENENEKLFHCENAECAVITCRRCKQLDHLPKSCQEAGEDKHLNGKHKVEEAMTRALMRNCPNCQKAFIKETGCNKMKCPNCRTLFCYVCRQAIAGYDHFDDDRLGFATGSGRCTLWDPVELRHEEEVMAAEEQALAEYNLQFPEVDEPVDVLEAEPATAAYNPVEPLHPPDLFMPQDDEPFAQPPDAVLAPDIIDSRPLPLPLNIPTYDLPQSNHGTFSLMRRALPPSPSGSTTPLKSPISFRRALPAIPFPSPVCQTSLSTSA